MRRLVPPACPLLSRMENRGPALVPRRRLSPRRRLGRSGGRQSVSALGNRYHGDGRWPGAAAAVGPRRVRMLGNGAGPGREARGDLRSPARPDAASQGLGRRASGRGDGVRHPGRLQPPSGGSRRLGVGCAVATVGGAASADLGPRLRIQSPVPGVHRPSGRRRGRPCWCRARPARSRSRVFIPITAPWRQTSY